MEIFVQTLFIMAKGMLGIFVITGIIILAMVLLNKIGKPKNGPQ